MNLRFFENLLSAAVMVVALWVNFNHIVLCVVVIKQVTSWNKIDSTCTYLVALGTCNDCVINAGYIWQNLSAFTPKT